jgi:5'-nucleotidase
MIAMFARNCLTALICALLVACAAPQAGRQVATVTVGIAAINDFHGALEPPRQAVPTPDGKGDVVLVPAGGAAWLASAIDAVRAKYPNHLTVSAGDLIGGSAVTSAIFLDEPTIGAMNLIGLDFNAAGNHEFDAGIEELLRKQNGGCVQHTARRPCQVEQFKGARFGFLAGNTVLPDGRTLFPATAMRTFGNGRARVKVGLIGLTLKGTDELIPTDVSSRVRFLDEADTANAAAARLRAEGASAIVLLIHQGSYTGGNPPDPNGCDELKQYMPQILDRLDTSIDVVVSGHTHWAYVCDYARYNPAKPFLLTSAGLWGKLVTDITLEVDPARRRVVAKRAHNVIVQSPGYRASSQQIEPTDRYPKFGPRPDLAAYVERYSKAAAEFSRRKIGTIAAPVDKLEGNLSNTGGPLGNLIADAQLAATLGAGAQITFMNPFGIRRSLGAAADGSVTFGDIYQVQPFNNELVTLTLTGADIKAVLEQGFDAQAPEQVLTPSHGFIFTYDRSRPIGSRIVSMTLDGAPIDPARDYRVTVSMFLANGGDSFTAFRNGRNRTIGGLDIAALEAWLQAVPPRVAPSEPRHTDLRADLTPTRISAPPGQKYR